jgi:UDP-glucose 4-epimerase
VFNVGRGEGFSVKEVMAAVAVALGREFEYDIVGRRAGDPPRLVASVDRISQALGWRATRDLADMASGAWAAWQAHPPR